MGALNDQDFKILFMKKISVNMDFFPKFNEISNKIFPILLYFFIKM